MDLPARTTALKGLLDAMPGATANPMTAATGKVPLVILYKIAGKMFAILSARTSEFVILKSDPHLAEILRETYAGVGHRSHLDRRFWIAVDLDSDVPAEEVERMVRASYDLVRAGLARKQKAALGGA